MPTASQPITSLLAIDISPAMIGAFLIERQEGIYRFIGAGRAPLSINAQGLVNRKCLVKALRELAQNTGHELLAENGDVLIPATDQSSGADRICLAWSLPAPIKVVLIGLMPSWSIQSGMRLVEELPLELIDQISITDGRTEEERMDVILSKRPDLIVMTGGVEGGADDVIRSSTDLVARSLSALPQELRPEMVYAGNSRIAEYVKNKLEPLTLIFTAPNIQPVLSELDLQPAREVLAGVCNRMWVKRFGLQPGTRALVPEQMRPSIRAMEDFISILGVCEKSNQGVIAIQLNGLTTGLSVSYSGRSTSYQKLNGCMHPNPGKLISEYKLADVAVWSRETIEPSTLAEYLAAEVLYPGRLPVSDLDAAIGESLIRLTGLRAWQSLSEKQEFPHQIKSKNAGADADIIMIGGDRVYHQPDQNRALLQMLDILQPIGLSEIFIDQNGLATSLGAAAHLDPKIPLHCILGQAVTRLATVIAPIHKARDGARLLSVVIVDESGLETKYEINAGVLTSIPLSPGSKVELKIRLFHGAKMGSRFDARRMVTVTGSLLGIVIDARGRPLIPKKDPIAQQAWMIHSYEQALELVR